MVKIRWSSVLILLGALGVFSATIFHPPLTDPWDTQFAYHEMLDHHHWVLDHWVFMLGLILWLIGLAILADSYSYSKKERSFGGRSAARCFIAALMMWLLILAVEIAVFPPLVDQTGEAARTIWNAFFTWGLFAGYLAMGLIYIGIILFSASCIGLMRVFALLAGILGICGVIVSLLLPNAALVVQLVTAPFPYLWTVWFALRFIK